jgi:Cdc6-like AAA superfamily ATPase
VEQCKSVELPSTAETKLFYQLQPATRVTVTSPATDVGTAAGIVQPAASQVQSVLSGLPLLQSLVAAQGFAGYHAEATEALSVAALGLGLSHLLRDVSIHGHGTSGAATDAQAPPLPPSASPSTVAAPTSAVARDLMRPPKGLILYGPPGTGKTTLMHAVVAALRCNYLEMSHSLLLSR